MSLGDARSGHLSSLQQSFRLKISADQAPESGVEIVGESGGEVEPGTFVAFNMHLPRTVHIVRSGPESRLMTEVLKQLTGINGWQQFPACYRTRPEPPASSLSAMGRPPG